MKVIANLLTDEGYRLGLYIFENDKGHLFYEINNPYSLIQGFIVK